MKKKEPKQKQERTGSQQTTIAITADNRDRIKALGKEHGLTPNEVLEKMLESFSDLSSDDSKKAVMRASSTEIIREEVNQERLDRLEQGLSYLIQRAIKEDKVKESRRKLLAAPKSKSDTGTDINLLTLQMGKALEQMRTEKGLSKADVTKMTGLSAKVIAGLEKGDGKPYLLPFLQYAAIFDIQKLMALYVKIE